ncbi:MAG TPA: hypothetical protein VGH98_25895 [Gemmatimonadaceae bacterium]|jgi:hypothetical protein
MPDATPPFDELPELMVSLRRIGSRRSQPNELQDTVEEQERYFAPLLDARRTAAKAVTSAQVMAAFEGRRLTALIDAAIRAFASERYATRAPARRAFEAELFELIEPLRAEIQSLRQLAEKPLSADNTQEQQAQWSLWLAQLKVVFRIADSSWPSLAEALGSAKRAAASARGRRSSGGGRSE